MVIIEYTFKDLHAGKYDHEIVAIKKKTKGQLMKILAVNIDKVRTSRVSQQSTRRPSKTFRH